MKSARSIKFDLTDAEKKRLRQQKMKKADLTELAADEIEIVLAASVERARHLYALITFQKVPSIGIKFAEDLIFLGYYSLEEIAGKSGAALVEAYERKKGYWIDPCVEDQFRLIAHVAEHGPTSKQWHEFTPERKAYRAQYGYPVDRPTLAWHETEAYSSKS